MGLSGLLRALRRAAPTASAARQAIEQAGGRLLGLYLVMGDHDLVAISEAPDDETYARTILAAAARGAVRTKTLKAFTEEEYRRIIGALP